MSKRAICDNDGCGRAADLTRPYQTIPDGWYSLTLGDRITSRDVCGLDCLEAVVAAERVRADAQVDAENLPVPPAAPRRTEIPF